MPFDPLNNMKPTMGGTWINGVWHNNASDDPNSQAYKNFQQQNADYYRMEHDPNSPYNQANQLAAKEQTLLGRQAPAISQVMTGGLQQARGNQMQALGAQQALMQGPSLAGMRANQAFGAQQQQLMGAQNPMAMRQAMAGGANALGAAAAHAGNSVGQEWLQGQQGIANSTNTLGQGDIASQQALRDLQAKQQQLFLQQRQQNLNAAQGYEQNYYNLQNAYTQAAQAAIAARYKSDAQKNALGWQVEGGVMQAIPFIGGAAAGAVKSYGADQQTQQSQDTLGGGAIDGGVYGGGGA